MAERYPCPARRDRRALAVVEDAVSAAPSGRSFSPASYEKAKSPCKCSSQLSVCFVGAVKHELHKQKPQNCSTNICLSEFLLVWQGMVGTDWCLSLDACVNRRGRNAAAIYTCMANDATEVRRHAASGLCGGREQPRYPMLWQSHQQPQSWRSGSR